ncbi:MAG TPA: hypothetical protein VG936_16165 [Lacunisphaera sp.]|nr:hypothetical protein [Lacunisphaera sp.]
MTMLPERDRTRVLLLAWWIIWAGILAGLVAIYLVLGHGPKPAAAPDQALSGLIGLGPLFLSVITRWLVLPRFRDPNRALPVFIAGLAMAEACGLLGIFLGGPYRDDLFLLGVLGVLQFVPLFARRMFEAPGTPGFFPRG